MNAIVPRIHFDSVDLPAEVRFPAWSSAVAAYDVTQPDDAAPDSFRALVDAWMIGDLVVTSTQLSGVHFARSVQKAKADGVDHYSFLLLKQGSWTGDVGGRLMTIGPGQIVCFDLAQPMAAGGNGSDSVTVGIARHTLELLMPRVPDIHGIVLGGTKGRFLADHFLSLVHHLPTMEQADAPAFAKASAGIIAACIVNAAQDEGDAATSGVRHRIRRYIDDNLALPELNPEHICQQLGLSRATLYRTFAGSKGIASYIRTRRLEAVHVLLNDLGERRNIADIAFGFGFSSDVQFSKAFRREFGYSPRDARAAAKTGSSPGGEPAKNAADGPTAFRAWMDKIS